MNLDKKLIQQRFGQHFAQYHQLATTQKYVSRYLAELIATHVSIGNNITRACEIGAGTGFLTQHLIEQFPLAHWTINDLAQESEPFINQLTQQVNSQFIAGDAETLALPLQLDLIASSSAFQWFNELDKFLIKAFSSLSSGGICAFTLYGNHNFREIAQLGQIHLQYHSLKSLQTLMEQLSFRILHASEKLIPMIFPSPKEVLYHIKNTGMNGIASPSWRKSQYQHFLKSYTELFPAQEHADSVELTYHPLFFILQKSNS